MVQWQKNPPANIGDGFDPWSRRIPCAIEQLSLCTTIKPVFGSQGIATTEAMGSNY